MSPALGGSDRGLLKDLARWVTQPDGSHAHRVPGAPASPASPVGDRAALAAALCDGALAADIWPRPHGPEDLEGWILRVLTDRTMVSEARARFARPSTLRAAAATAAFLGLVDDLHLSPEQVRALREVALGEVAEHDVCDVLPLTLAPLSDTPEAVAAVVLVAWPTCPPEVLGAIAIRYAWWSTLTASTIDHPAATATTWHTILTALERWSAGHDDRAPRDWDIAATVLTSLLSTAAVRAHLAATPGDEMIVRRLLSSGASAMDPAVAALYWAFAPPARFAQAFASAPWVLDDRGMPVLLDRVPRGIEVLGLTLQFLWTRMGEQERAARLASLRPEQFAPLLDAASEDVRLLALRSLAWSSDGAQTTGLG